MDCDTSYKKEIALPKTGEYYSSILDRKRRTIDPHEWRISRVMKLNARKEKSNVISLEKMFNELAISWKIETGAFSTSADKISNDSFKLIVKMGWFAVPFILKEYKREPYHWYLVLEEITEDNPVPPEHINKMMLIREDWLNWGLRKGYPVL